LEKPLEQPLILHIFKWRGTILAVMITYVSPMITHVSPLLVLSLI